MKPYQYITFSTLLFISAFTLSACSNNNGTEAKIAFNSAHYLNPDINGHASPVVVSLYELKTPFEFKQANFMQLDQNASSLLGTNLIDKQTVEIRPGAQKIITQSITPNTHYLGIAAAYRNIDSASWRSVINIPEKTKKITVQVNLESEGLIAKRIG